MTIIVIKLSLTGYFFTLYELCKCPKVIKYYIANMRSMNLSSRKNEVSIHSYSSVADYVELNTAQKQIIESASHSSDYNYCDNAINHLDLAEGLKSMLIRHGFDLRSLIVTQHRELAETFGIDNYVANLIINAARDITIEDKKINVSYSNNLWSNHYEP